MSRWEKIAFIRVNLGYRTGMDLDHYSDRELDTLIQEIVHTVHCKDLGVQKMKSMYVFMN